MKYKTALFFIPICMVLLSSCEPKTPEKNKCALHVLVHLPDSCELGGASLAFEDRNMGSVTRFEEAAVIADTCVAFQVMLPAGFYACTFEAQVKVSEDYSMYSPQIWMCHYRATLPRP